MKKILIISFAFIVCLSLQISAQIPVKTLVSIVKAEDELRFDKTLEDLLKSKDANIRARAALAAGGIGDAKAVPALVNLLETDKDTNVRAMSAFALGEIESIDAADSLLKILKDTKQPNEIRARAIEAAGKIAAANDETEKGDELRTAISNALEFEAGKNAKEQNRDIILLGITAALRAKTVETETVVAKFLTNSDGRIRADAANTMARLRVKTANEQFRIMLTKDSDPNARANAARALGAGEDKGAVNMLETAAMTDNDLRVRINAIRSLGSLKDAKSADKLLERGEKLFADYKKSKFANPSEKNELLEIATALGNTFKNTKNGKATKFLDDFRQAESLKSPEIDIALARIDAVNYSSQYSGKSSKFYILDDKPETHWLVDSAIAQGLGETANIFENKDNESRKQNENILRNSLINSGNEINITKDERSIPDILRAFGTFKTEDLPNVLQLFLTSKDVIIRATAAELLSEQPTNNQIIKSLQIAFSKSLLTDRDYNDAQLAILSALVKLDKNASIGQLATALNHYDYLVRRRAADLIKENDLLKDYPKLGDIEAKVGTVKNYDAKFKSKLGQVLNSEKDYTRAVSRKNGSVKAVFTTEKGNFTIELLPEDAPLTVDNFVKLANSGYFNGIAFHRVVPNFVVQDGDPRGDGNGGPGWSIRDEINTVPYERGAVGMALSGKNTGGSQWFVTHSPQPHLDGGYTVFGKVNDEGMKIVDMIVRGDKIIKVEIVKSLK